MAACPAVERKEGMEDVPGVPRRAGIDRGCCFQEGVHGDFRGFPTQKVVFRAPLLVVLFLLPPALRGRVVRREFSVDALVVLLGFHGVG